MSLQKVAQFERFAAKYLRLAAGLDGVIMAAPKKLREPWQPPSNLKEVIFDGWCDTQRTLRIELQKRLGEVFPDSVEVQRNLTQRAQRVLWKLRALYAPANQKVEFRMLIQIGSRNTGAPVHAHCDEVPALMFTDIGPRPVLYLREQGAKHCDFLDPSEPTTRMQIPELALSLIGTDLAHGSPEVQAGTIRIGYVVYRPRYKRKFMHSA